MRFSESTKTGLRPSNDRPSGREYVTNALSRRRSIPFASDPQVAFPVFKHRRHCFAGSVVDRVQVRSASLIDSQQAPGVRAGPDIPVAIALHREHLELIERCRSRPDQAAPVPAHDAAVRAYPQISFGAG